MNLVRITTEDQNETPRSTVPVNISLNENSIVSKTTK